MHLSVRLLPSQREEDFSLSVISKLIDFSERVFEARHVVNNSSICWDQLPSCYAPKITYVSRSLKRVFN